MIKVYMILKIFRIFFLYIRKKPPGKKDMTKTPFNTHQKQNYHWQVWRASDFYPTLFLDGLEAAAFGGALALERSASSMAKEIRLQLGI